MTTPKAQPSSALQLTRFNNGWLAIQTAISTAEKRNVTIQQTDIPVRLKNMVDLLVDEESRLEDDAMGTTGVCMEYLLKHNVLGKLVNHAEKDLPKGLTGETIRTFAGMINLLDDRFLVHNSVHKPTVKLLRNCCAPGTELLEDGNEDYHEDLVDLMYILCSKIHGYPELLNIFFYDRQWLTVPERVTARRLQKNRETMALLRSLSRRSSLALSTMEDDPPTSQKKDSTTLKEEDGEEEGEPMARPGHLGRSMTAASLQGYEEHQDSKRDYEFLLFTYLSKFVHREGKAGDFARTGLLFLMELATGSLGEYILDSEFASYLTAGVGALYSQLPRKLIVKTDPNNLTSGSGHNSGSNTTHPPETKPSRRTNIELSTSKDFQSRLDAFLRVLEFCQDVLMRCPNTEIATTLLASFKTVFLENILYPSILECSDTDGSSVAVISYIDLILQALEHEALVDLVVGFLMASEEEDTRTNKVLEDTDAFAEVQNPQTTSPYFMATGRFTLKDLVLSRLKSRSQPTVIATLKLLNTVITRHCKYSLKLLSIQPDNRATDMPGQQPYRSVPLINHHAHELDLFFGLIATINPVNTQEIFCCGYESYLRDAEGSIEKHQCLMGNSTNDSNNNSNSATTAEAQKTTGGTLAEAELKKQRRRSTKYGHRTTDNMTEDLSAEALIQNLDKVGSNAATTATLGHAGQHPLGHRHPVPMHRLLPSDPLLQILLGTLSHFFAHTVELNLALTGVITSLAICPYRSLEGWLLFKSSDVKRSNVDRGSEDDSDSSDSQGLHQIDSELDADKMNDDSDDEDSLPSYLTRNVTRAGLEFSMPPLGPPSFKSFPPFFTMLRTLTQQVDYYRSEIDEFDEYLADRRRTLLGTTETMTTITANPGGPQGSVDQQQQQQPSSNSVYHQSSFMFASSESFFGSSGDLSLGGGGRPSTPTILTGNLPHTTGGGGGPASPRYLGNNGGQSGAGSRVSSPAPQRANSKTPVQAVVAGGPVSLVRISSPRARKSSSPSSLMSSPSNMSFLIPPGVGGKRNFKSNSASPLAGTAPRFPSVPTLEIDSSQSNSTQQQLATAGDGPLRTLSPAPVSQPRALWAPAPTSRSRAGSLSLLSTTSPLPPPPPVAFGTSTNHQHQSNLSMPQTQLLGSSTATATTTATTSPSPLAKVMETMMIKPLFPDGFLDDSDSEAETGLDIDAELSDDDNGSDSDDDTSEDDDDDDDDDGGDDTDEADRALNSDLQEPSPEARRRRRRQLKQQQKQQQQKQQQQQQLAAGGGGVKGMIAAAGRSASQLLQSSAVAKNNGQQGRRASTGPQQQQQQKEQLVSLSQLLTNVVILEEVVKEVVAVAQVRKGMGIDKVRFL
ncbi:hypothetical protein BGX33_004307 [Mortierella sp. NVP41]|nr:hypothetical protein BGX33_004307 [Mortierella sp. NVP41]